MSSRNSFGTIAALSVTAALLNGCKEDHRPDAPKLPEIKLTALPEAIKGKVQVQLIDLVTGTTPGIPEAYYSAIRVFKSQSDKGLSRIL